MGDVGQPILRDGSSYEQKTAPAETSLDTADLGLRTLANGAKVREDDTYATTLDASPNYLAADSDTDSVAEEVAATPSHAPPGTSHNIHFPLPSSVPPRRAASGLSSPGGGSAGSEVGGSDDMNMDSPVVLDGAGAEAAAPADAGGAAPEQVRKRKFELLYKIKALTKKGIPQPMPVDMSSDLSSIELTYDEMYDSYKRKSSVKLQRKMLVMGATCVEFLNARYDPFDFKLVGWSESLYEAVNNEEYDEVLEELYDKYKTKSRMAPEVKLLMMLGGSAFMHHTLSATFRAGMVGAAGAPPVGATVSPTAAPAAEMTGPSGMDELLKNFKQAAP